LSTMKRFSCPQPEYRSRVRGLGSFMEVSAITAERG
jgi:hypothetical protein